ncbi:MAG: Rap1a/Tai family immunity protein [Methyloceanibacter sp.]
MLFKDCQTGDGGRDDLGRGLCVGYVVGVTDTLKEGVVCLPEGAAFAVLTAQSLRVIEALKL